METISIHSHKGGSGKTLITMNLAALLAKRGKRVAIIDLDLSAPSLHTFAPNRKEKKINDYFMNGAKPEEVFFDATYLLGNNIPGKLFMGLADISGEAIAAINQRDNDSLLNDLYLLMELVRNKLPADPFNVDFIIIDTSPGLTQHAINGVAVTDRVVMVLRLVNADVEGTTHFLRTLYKNVQLEAALVVNQMPEKYIKSGGKELIEELVKARIVDQIEYKGIKLAGIIENDDNVTGNELSYAFSFIKNPNSIQTRPIHIMQESSQDFALKFEIVADKILGDKS